MKKICIITGTRAEYGLLRPLIMELRNTQKLEVQLLVTGMHLAPEFGLTVQEIEKDKIDVNEKIEVLLSSDTPVGITKSIGLGLISFAEVYSRIKPDLIIGLGDRFELFAAVTAALIARIPVAHIHGGEKTLGVFDEALRHSITKMSHLHFTATEEYRRRVIQLGENPKFVFNVGALGIDNLVKVNPLSKDELEKLLNFKIEKPTFLVTFHPVTLEKSATLNQFKQLLNALSDLEFIRIIFTKPNADTESRNIIKSIDEFVKKNNERCVAFESMGQLRYISALHYVDGMIGNSSSGIIEMPFFKKGTVNIGNRQKGRLYPQSVIQCDPAKEEIKKAIQLVLSDGFKTKIKNMINPYGDGNAAVRIKDVILNTNLDTVILKEFYDLKSSEY